MSGIVKGLFGGKSRAEKQLEQFSPSGFSSPGISGRFNQGTNSFDLTRSEGLSSAISNLVSGFQNRAGLLKGQRENVAPGFGGLTKARLEGLRSARQRGIGNLRGELQKRRVLGSSFAQSQIAGAEAEFGLREGEIRAESFLGELQLTNELITQETQASIDAAGSLIEQFNLESGLAAGLSESASAQINANIRGQAEAAAASAAGSAEFLGTVIGAFA